MTERRGIRRAYRLRLAASQLGSPAELRERGLDLRGAQSYSAERRRSGSCCFQQASGLYFFLASAIHSLQTPKGSRLSLRQPAIV